MNIFVKIILKFIKNQYSDKNKLLDTIEPIYEKYIFKCVKIEDKFEKLTKYLLELTFIKENNYNEIVLETKIKRTLGKMGFNCNHDGSKYIVEIVKHFHNNPEKFKLNRAFDYLSNKYNKSSNTIKGAIREANLYMNKNCNKEFVENYFNYIDLVKYPTVSEVIRTILEKL